MPALHRLLALTRDQRPVGKSFRATLEAIFAGGKQPALVHLLLGIDSERQNRPEEAWHDFEQAFRNNSEMVVLANELARELATTEPTDRNTALAMINAAIDIWPNPVGFATRGATSWRNWGVGRRHSPISRRPYRPWPTRRRRTELLRRPVNISAWSSWPPSTNALPAMDRREDDREVLSAFNPVVQRRRRFFEADCPEVERLIAVAAGDRTDLNIALDRSSEADCDSRRATAPAHSGH